jgi:hypothetical protein
LRSAGLKLLERISRNKYTVRLRPSEVDGLGAMEFIDYVRLYSEDDTIAPTSKAPPEAATATRGAASAERKTSIYQVRLHRAKDLAAVLRWLRSRRRKPIWKSGDQFQVGMIEDSAVLRDLARRPEVASVERVEMKALFDGFARELLGLIRGNVSIGLEGEGEIIGIADTGIDDAHPDFKGRIIGKVALGRPGDTSDPEGHGTHVAGCALGDGSASAGEIVGAAPKAKLFFQSILDPKGGLGGLPKDIGDLLKEAYEKGVRIHNNSWGAFTFAAYSNSSDDIDRFVAANPDMLVVIAAGNDGIGIPRVPGAIMSAKPGFVDWPTVASPATAKNSLTVGASRSSRSSGGYSELCWNDVWPISYPVPPISAELISSDAESLAAFSSRGPADKTRIKPDVVAPGTDIAAARSKDAPLHKFWGAYPNNQNYGFMGGTSMAAPYVAGCAALVREWYRKNANWPTPSAALLKATLINGTKRIAGQDAVAEIPGDPNFHQGFGRIDMVSTVPNPANPKLRLEFADGWNDQSKAFLQTGDRYRFRVSVAAGLPLRVCLAWTDPRGRGLQNSLLLLVDDGTSRKWIGNEGASTLLNVAGAIRDTDNNVQCVRVEKPKKANYTIVVVATTLLMSPQSFALVVAGNLESALLPA